MPRGNHGRVLVQAVVLIAIGTAVGIGDLVVRGVPTALGANRGNAAERLLNPKPPPPVKPEDGNPGSGTKAPDPGPEKAPDPRPDPSPEPSPETRPADWPENHITITKALALYKTGQVYFVDARPKNEYVEGHVPGAYNLPVSAFDGGFPQQVYSMDYTRPTIVYCSGSDECEAAEDVAIQLQAAQFHELYIMHEGWPGWTAAGNPVQTGEDPNGF